MTISTVAITAGSGTGIAVDNFSSSNYQMVKIDNGATGVAGGPVCATNPMPVASPVPTIGTSAAYAHTAVTTAYSSGQLWANNTAAGSVTFGTVTLAKANDQAFTIVGGSLQKSGTSVTNSIFRAYLFTAAPTTSVADRGTFAGNLTLANCIGYLDFNINQQGSDVSFGLGNVSLGTLIATIPVSGAKTLYFAIMVNGAYTPTSSETLTLTLWGQ